MYRVQFGELECGNWGLKNKRPTSQPHSPESFTPTLEGKIREDQDSLSS